MVFLPILTSSGLNKWRCSPGWLLRMSPNMVHYRRRPRWNSKPLSTQESALYYSSQFRLGNLIFGLLGRDDISLSTCFLARLQYTYSLKLLKPAQTPQMQSLAGQAGRIFSPCSRNCLFFCLCLCWTLEPWAS